MAWYGHKDFSVMQIIFEEEFRPGLGFSFPRAVSEVGQREQLAALWNLGAAPPQARNAGRPGPN